MADAEPDWVRYARKVLRWYPEHTRWALAEIDAWERASAVARRRYDAERRRIYAGNADGVSLKDTA